MYITIERTSIYRPALENTVLVRYEDKTVNNL